MVNVFKAGLLALWIPLAQAAPLVSYTDTAKFSDFGDSMVDRERNEKELTAFLESLAQRLPGDQQIRFEVKDVNLAGELEWLRGPVQRLRVMRNSTIPSMSFHYTLSQGSQVLKEEDVDLRDLDYLYRSSLKWRNESLGPEKAMLERWFLRTLVRR